MIIINNGGNKISFKVIILALSIIFSFINKFVYGGGISSIIVYILAFGLLYIFQQRKVTITKYHYAFIIFWFIFILSTVLSPTTDLKQDIFTFGISVIYLILVSSVDYTQKEIKFISNIYIFTAFISALNIIYNWSINNQYTWQRFSTSFYGIGKDPNYASAFITPAIIILLYRILLNENKKIKDIFILMLITIGSLLTGSRSAFLFILFNYAFVVIVLLFKRSKVSMKKLITVIITVIISVLVISISSDVLPKETIERILSFKSYKGGAGRLDIWLESIKTIYINPIIGIGLNGLNDYLISEDMLSSHNVYLDIFTGSGILGSIVFIYAIYQILKVKKNDKIYIIGLMISMLGPLFFINGFNTPNFWIPIILLSIIQRHSWKNDEILYKFI